MDDDNKRALQKLLENALLPRGCGSPTTYTSDRLPRWSKWRLMPEVKKWEAVALSLNIEPGEIKTNSHGGMGAARTVSLVKCFLIIFEYFFRCFHIVLPLYPALLADLIDAECLNLS